MGYTQQRAGMLISSWILYLATVAGTNIYIGRTDAANEAGMSAPGTTDYPNGGMRLVGVLPGVGGGWWNTMIIDPSGGYVYPTLAYHPSQITKIALNGANTPVLIGTTQLNPGEAGIFGSAIDLAHGYAYYGVADRPNPGIVVKVALGNGDELPRRVGSLTLNSEESGLGPAVIDPAAGYVYFGSAGPEVVKVAVGEGDQLPTRVGAAVLNPGESPSSAVIDLSKGFAYFGTDSYPATVVKVALGQGSDPPVRIGSARFLSDENVARCAVIDPANGYGYFGATTPSGGGKVVKVALGSGSDPPTRVSYVTVPTYYPSSDSVSGVECFPTCDVVQTGIGCPAAGLAYFVLQANPPLIFKISLGQGDAPPVLSGHIRLSGVDAYLNTSAIDADAGYAYFGSIYSGTIYPFPFVKLAISQNGYLKATKVNLLERAAVMNVSFYSHAAKGHARLSIYDGSSSPTLGLLWQSYPVTNTAQEDWLTIPITYGSPRALTLQPGNYWLAWQVDSNADIPSYTPGAQGDGFYVPLPFGETPSAIEATSATLTNETWSEFLSYDPPINGAQYLGTTAPASVPVGTTLGIGMTLRNTGNTVWDPAQGYSLAVTSDSCSLFGGQTTVPLTASPSILPGENTQLVAYIHLPPAPEACSAQLTMTQNGNSFGEPVTINIIAREPINPVHDWALYE